MAAIEFSAVDVETAIAQGLKQLNLLRAEAKIEVLDDGSRGVLGIGARQARVRLTPFAETEDAATGLTAAPVDVATPRAQPVQPTSPPSPRPSEGSARDIHTKRLDEHALVTKPDAFNAKAIGAPGDMDETGHPGQASNPASLAKTNPGHTSAGEATRADATSASDAPGTDLDPAAQKIEGEDLAFTLVRGILDRMGLADAKVNARSVFPADSDDEPSIWIDIDLDEEELFLGYQHEGLNALQTIVQTMWSHQVKSSLRVNLDVNGFRARREQQLQNMARRMAERVLENGKPITLEPMPASERRIVHMTLREMEGVMTESSGEGPSRKVQIKPKK